MGFKKEGFNKVFPEWEKIWRRWIEPAPFAFYGDPDPEFQGSAFCIEQYSLGLTLENLGALHDGSIYYITRRQVLFKDVPQQVAETTPTFKIPFEYLVYGPPANEQNILGSGGITHLDSYPFGKLGSYQLGSPQLGSSQLGSYQLGSYQLGSYQLGSYQLGSYQLGSSQLGSYQLGSYQLGSSQLGSYQLGSYQLGSYQLGSLQLGSLQLGSLQLGSLQLGSYQLGSYQLGSYQLGSYQLGSYQLGSLQLGSYPLGSYPLGSLQLGSYQLGSLQLPGSIEFNYTKEALATSDFVGVIPINTQHNRDIVVDNFAGSVLHFYSFNYQPGYQIWTENKDKIATSLDNFWKKPSTQ